MRKNFFFKLFQYIYKYIDLTLTIFRAKKGRGRFFIVIRNEETPTILLDFFQKIGYIVSYRYTDKVKKGYIEIILKDEMNKKPSSSK